MISNIKMKYEYNVVILRKDSDKMYDSICEEYMRSVLGYKPVNYEHIYDSVYDRTDRIERSNRPVMNNFYIQELENCYPEIYKIVYPMVQKICCENTRSISKELIDSMTDEIYFSIEDRELVENRNKEQNVDLKIENRQIRRNTNLNDLIRILILRELLGNPGFLGINHPQLPMRPPRPLMGPSIGTYIR